MKTLEQFLLTREDLAHKMAKLSGILGRIGLSERQAILEELVDMSAALKGEATSINRTISLQTDKLGELGDTAEDNQSKVASETKSLTKFYRSSSSFFATLFRSIAVLVAFILTVLYMSLFSKRF